MSAQPISKGDDSCQHRPRPILHSTEQSCAGSPFDPEAGVDVNRRVHSQKVRQHPLAGLPIHHSLAHVGKRCQPQPRAGTVMQTNSHEASPPPTRCKTISRGEWKGDGLRVEEESGLGLWWRESTHLGILEKCADILVLHSLLLRHANPNPAPIPVYKIAKGSPTPLAPPPHPHHPTPCDPLTPAVSPPSQPRPCPSSLNC